MTLTAELGRRLYTDMWRIRLFEEEALRQTSLGSVKGALHTYCGEEAVAVGCVRICATTTMCSAPTAATGTASRRARRWSA